MLYFLFDLWDVITWHTKFEENLGDIKSISSLKACYDHEHNRFTDTAYIIDGDISEPSAVLNLFTGTVTETTIKISWISKSGEHTEQIPGEVPINYTCLPEINHELPDLSGM